MSEEYISQDKQEEAAHAARGWLLEEEPEIDADLDEEIDAMIWEGLTSQDDDQHSNEV